MPRVAVPGQGGHPMRAQQADLVGQLGVVRRDHAPFGRGDILVGEKAEAADLTPTAQGCHLSGMPPGHAPHLR